MIIVYRLIYDHNWFWPECPCSWIRAAQFSRSGRPKRGNLESSGGKNERVRLRRFLLNWQERTNEKRSKNRRYEIVFFPHYCCRFDLDELRRFVLTVRKNYRRVPYHNWTHAFAVAHCMYTVIRSNEGMFDTLEVNIG